MPTDLHVLRAIDACGDNAYGNTIRDALGGNAGWSIAGLYSVLDRLVEEDLVWRVMGEATAERGWKRKRYYRLTSLGRRKLSSEK